MGKKQIASFQRNPAVGNGCETREKKVECLEGKKWLREKRK